MAGRAFWDECVLITVLRLPSSDGMAVAPGEDIAHDRLHMVRGRWLKMTRGHTSTDSYSSTPTLLCNTFVTNRQNLLTPPLPRAAGVRDR